jgi:hypothetical protein
MCCLQNKTVVSVSCGMHHTAALLDSGDMYAGTLPSLYFCNILAGTCGALESASPLALMMQPATLRASSCAAAGMAGWVSTMSSSRTLPRSA